MYESEDRGIRLNDLESSFNLDIHGTRKPFVHGENTKVHASTQYLQQEKRRVREIRAEQIERLVGTKATVFRGPHPCVVREGIMLDEGISPLRQKRFTHAGNIPEYNVTTT